MVLHLLSRSQTGGKAPGIYWTCGGTGRKVSGVSIISFLLDS